MASPNSTGQTGRMSGSGSASVANNDLTLGAERLPLNSFGYFLTGTAQASTPVPNANQSILCIGGPIGRYTGPGQLRNSGSSGTFSLQIDLARTPTPTGIVAVVAGQTRNFQAWHRDAVNGTAVSNFTDGLSVTFL